MQVELLEYRKKKLELEPLKLNQAFESSASLDFRRVLCNGAFDEGRSVFVGPRSRSISGVTENGYYVITPLVPNPSHPHRQVFLYRVNSVRRITLQSTFTFSLSFPRCYIQILVLCQSALAFFLVEYQGPIVCLFRTRLKFFPSSYCGRKYAYYS